MCNRIRLFFAAIYSEKNKAASLRLVKEQSEWPGDYSNHSK